jgi:hypothetical protein
MKKELKRLQEELLKELEARLSPHGFTRRKKDQTLHRTFDKGADAIHLSFIEHATDFDATVEIAVRMNAIEELVNRYPPAAAKGKQATYTLGVELGNLRGTGQQRYEIRAAEDVIPAAEAIAEAVREVGFPCLERYRSPEYVLEILSGDASESWLHCPFHHERAKRACAALALMDRALEIPGVAEKKRQFMKSIEDLNLRFFDEFLQAFQL